jgi:hypothetical protein
MKYELTYEDINLLGRINHYLNQSPVVEAVYRSPAANLRLQADFLEQKEKDIYAYQLLLSRLTPVKEKVDF